MSVFARYTLRSLRRNPARTLVTVIGIILSMALFTAVIEGAYSGQQYLIRSEEEMNGPWHGWYSDLTPEQKDRVLADDRIDRASVWQTVGWMDLGGERSSDCYLYVAAVDSAFTGLVPSWLREGRMPENDHEIALPDSYAVSVDEEGNDVANYRVGDTVTLSLGRRVREDGSELGELDYYDPENYPEEIVDAAERTYTVVGILGVPNYTVTDSGTCGQLAFTGGGGVGSCRVYFTLKDIGGYERYAEEARPLTIYPHFQLLRFHGIMGGKTLMVLLYGLVAVLVLLVSFGSVSLIYNAFSISIGERTRQYGLLKSVGATKKQIRGSVLTEALFLSAVGIPAGLIVGCAGIGITLWAIRDMLARLLGGEGLTTRAGLVLHPLALLAACAVCLGTVLLSAWVPARRAEKLTAIEAIRQTGDVKMTAREVRVSPLTVKLFGFPGLMAAKGFKRDKRRCRATVLSLFLSVVLFISASSFCAYLTDSADTLTAGQNTTDVWTMGASREDADAEDPDKTLALLSSAEGTRDGLYYVRSSVGDLWLDVDKLTREFRAFLDDPSHPTLWVESGQVELNRVHAVFLQDQAFRELCAGCGADPERFFDPAAPRALLYNHLITTFYWEDGMERGQWTLADPAAFPLEVCSRTRVDPEGYVLLAEEPVDGGERLYYYYLEDRLPELGDQFTLDDLDPDLTLVLPEDQVIFTAFYQVEGAVETIPFAFDTTDPILFYPYSMIPSVLSEEEAGRQMVEYAFLSSSPALTAARMNRLAADAGMDMGAADQSQYRSRTRMAVQIVNVFAYGFIILISLIAAANVFNTISTNISLRRREFAMLESMGLSRRGLRRMLWYECAVYGLRGLLWGLPAAAAVAYVIYRVVSRAVLSTRYYIPWQGVAIAAGSVFLVVFATMLYAARKLRGSDLTEALRSENF